MNNREAARETLMQLVFQMEMQDDYSEELKDRFLESTDTDEKQLKYINGVFATIKDKLEDIDRIINESSIGWKTDRMPKVDLAIARVAVAEMYFDDNVPDKVAINEAVRIAKAFGNDDSYKFLNGLLGKAYKLKNEQQ